MNQFVRILLLNFLVLVILTGTFANYLFVGPVIYVIGAVGISIYLALKGDNTKARAVFLSLLIVLLIGFSFCSVMAG